MNVIFGSARSVAASTADHGRAAARGASVMPHRSRAGSGLSFDRTVLALSHPGPRQPTHLGVDGLVHVVDNGRLTVIAQEVDPAPRGQGTREHGEYPRLPSFMAHRVMDAGPIRARKKKKRSGQTPWQAAWDRQQGPGS